MAAPAEAKRLGAVERLRAGRKVDVGILHVGHRDGQGYLHAAEGVDDGGELLEVELRVVRDVHPRELGDLLDHVGSAAKGVCSVDLLRPVLAHVHHGVSWDRDERDLLVGRVNAREDDRVRAIVRLVGAPLPRALLVLVDPKQQHVEGVVGLCGGDELVEEVRVDALGELAVDVVHIPCERGARDGKDGDKRDHHDLEHAMAALCLLALGDIVVDAVRAGCRVVHLVDFATAKVGGVSVCSRVAGTRVGASVGVATLYEGSAVEPPRFRAGGAAVAGSIALRGETVLLLG